MLAELHGKLDPLSTDPVERSEDLLTEAVFGSIRHLPRAEVLGPLLNAVGVRAAPKDLARATVSMWPSFAVSRWGVTSIEPDVVVVVGKQPVVFEAKLYSQFGKYYEPGGIGEPLHQLAVQYAAVRHWATGQQLASPVVVAVTAGSEAPTLDLHKAARDIPRIVSDFDGVPVLHWLPWRLIGSILEGAVGLRYHEHQHVEDVLALMDKRGVRRVFKGFKAEDYWLISAAQRVAAERVYPELRTFTEDLAAVLAEDGIGWTQLSAKWVWTSSGVALNKPVDWTRSYVGPMFWPTSWPTRTRLGAWAAIYAIFDFIDPALEVGLTIPGPGAGVAQATWTGHFPAMVSELTQLPDTFEMAFDGGDVARPTKVVNIKLLDADWLQSVASAAVGTSHLRLRLRHDPLSITVQQGRELVKSIRSAVEQCPAIWDMLRSSKHLSADSVSHT